MTKYKQQKKEILKCGNFYCIINIESKESNFIYKYTADLCNHIYLQYLILFHIQVHSVC